MHIIYYISDYNICRMTWPCNIASGLLLLTIKTVPSGTNNMVVLFVSSTFALLSFLNVTTTWSIFRNHSGKYSLSLENSAGAKTVSVDVVVLDTPSAPKDLRAADVTKESVTLTWQPPENDGGSVVSHYIVEKKETTKKAWSTVTLTCVRTTFKVIKYVFALCNRHVRNFTKSN